MDRKEQKTRGLMLSKIGKMGKKGAWNALYTYGAGILGVVILLVMTFFILDLFQGGTAPIFTADSYAANTTLMFKQGLWNAVQQVPNAGKIVGIAVIFGAFALIGIGAYAGYGKVKGGL